MVPTMGIRGPTRVPLQQNRALWKSFDHIGSWNPSPTKWQYVKVHGQTNSETLSQGCKHLWLSIVNALHDLHFSILPNMQPADIEATPTCRR